GRRARTGAQGRIGVVSASEDPSEIVKSSGLDSSRSANKLQSLMMRGGRCAAVVAGILLLSAGCASSIANHVTTSPGVVASANPETSPSTSASPTGAGPLAIVSLPFHNGEVALSYSATTLAANGGTQPYTWSIASGSFPPGLGLSPDGYVTGTPSAAGQFSFRVKLADAAGGTANRAASITVYKAMTVSQPCAGQCVIGVGCSKCGGFG